MIKKNVTHVRVGIVEDHAIFLSLLTSSLQSIPGISIEATAHTVSETKKWFQPHNLDVVLLDIDLPDGNGVGLGVQLRRVNPQLGLVFFSDKDLFELVLSLPKDIRSGASYLSKSSTRSVDVILNAILLSARGQVVIDANVVNHSRIKSGSPLSRLTQRQYEILQAVARGENNETIAQNLGITPNSVGKHLMAIYDILDIPEGKNERVAAVIEFLTYVDPLSQTTRT